MVVHISLLINIQKGYNKKKKTATTSIQVRSWKFKHDTLAPAEAEATQWYVRFAFFLSSNMRLFFIFMELIMFH
jgi:hypothetical protein